MVERALTNVEPRSGLTISAQQPPMWGAGLAHAARVPAPPNPLAQLAATPPGLAQRSHRPLGAGRETRVPETESQPGRGTALARWLPRNPAGTPSASPPWSGPQVPGGSGQGPQSRVGGPGGLGIRGPPGGCRWARGGGRAGGLAGGRGGGGAGAEPRPEAAVARPGGRSGCRGARLPGGSARAQRG